MNLDKYKIEYANGITQESFLVPKGVDFFTEESPLGKAMKSGKLVLPEQQGGTHKVKITKIENRIGLVAQLTKKQTKRLYFENIPVGTKFIIVDEHNDMPAYELTGYFLNYPPQPLGNNEFHYTGYIEKGSWEIVGTLSDYIKELMQQTK